jgi:hypothetical protein
MDDRLQGNGAVLLPDGNAIGCSYDLRQESSAARSSVAFSAGQSGITGTVTAHESKQQRRLFEETRNLGKSEELILHLEDHDLYLNILVTSPTGDCTGTGPLRDRERSS